MKQATRTSLKIITGLLLAGVALLLLTYVWDLGWFSREHIIKGIATLVILLIVIPLFDMVFGKH